MSHRRLLRNVRLVCLVASLLLQRVGACAGSPVGFDVVADVPLPGDTSRFDYESLDAGRHLLLIAHLGASEVLAFVFGVASLPLGVPVELELVLEVAD